MELWLLQLTDSVTLKQYTYSGVSWQSLPVTNLSVGYLSSIVMFYMSNTN